MINTGNKPDPPRTLADQVEKAMKRAFDLGQGYAVLGESMSYSDNARAEGKLNQFNALMDEIVAIVKENTK